MATRYLALASSDLGRSGPTLAQIGHARGTRLVSRSHSLAIFVGEQPDDFLPIGEDQGGIVGHLFTKEDTPRRVNLFDEATAARIRRQEGHFLARQFWGGYVAVIEGDDGRIRAVRDPSGLMPCWIIRGGDYTVLVSDIETAIQASLLVTNVDWDYLALYLRAYDRPSSATALAGVSELLAGHQADLLSPPAKPTAIWSPWDHTEPNRGPAKDLAEELHHVVTNCVGAWAGNFDHILLGVSGGLDSSIVAASLAQTSTDVTLLTLATREPHGDERAWAGCVAESLGMDVREAFYDLSDIDISRPTSSHLPRPLGRAFGQSAIKTKMNIAQEKGVDAFFSGIGGDNVFCFSQSATALVDRFQFEGLSPGLATTLDDICRLTDCSVWEALSMALKKAMSLAPSRSWLGQTDRFLSRHLPTAEQYNHPWLAVPKGALPGKAVHVSGIVRIQGTLDSYSRIQCGPQIHPLLSQPIVEFCLGIPTWFWCAGGCNRSLARQAFRSALPEAILERRSKGGPSSFAYEVAATFRDEIRTLLLDGQGTANHLFDRDSLEVALDPAKPFSNDDHVRLFELLEVETWARSFAKKGSGAHGPYAKTPTLFSHGGNR